MTKTILSGTVIFILCFVAAILVGTIASILVSIVFWDTSITREAADAYGYDYIRGSAILAAAIALICLKLNKVMEYIKCRL